MTRQFGRLFFWHVVRYTRRHPLLAGLNILSVALGVSVYLAIQIANHSANQSFAASIDLVAGKANLEVRAPSGGFDETALPKLTHAPGVKAATPLVEGYATLPDFPGDYLQILGVDVFTNLPFATFAIGGQSAKDVLDLDLDSWLGDPHGLAITDEFAQQHDLKVGSVLRLQVNGRRGDDDRALPDAPGGHRRGQGKLARRRARHRLGAGAVRQTGQALQHPAADRQTPRGRSRGPRPSPRSCRRT